MLAPAACDSAPVVTPGVVAQRFRVEAANAAPASGVLKSGVSSTPAAAPGPSASLHPP